MGYSRAAGRILWLMPHHMHAHTHTRVRVHARRRNSCRQGRAKPRRANGFSSSCIDLRVGFFFVIFFPSEFYFLFVSTIDKQKKFQCDPLVTRLSINIDVFVLFPFFLFLVENVEKCSSSIFFILHAQSVSSSFFSQKRRWKKKGSNNDRLPCWLRFWRSFFFLFRLHISVFYYYFFLILSIKTFSM